MGWKVIQLPGAVYAVGSLLPVPSVLLGVLSRHAVIIKYRSSLADPLKGKKDISTEQVVRVRPSLGPCVRLNKPKNKASLQTFFLYFLCREPAAR
jgi:hypothetical protein